MSLAEAIRRTEDGLRTTSWELKNPDADIVTHGSTFRGERSFKTGAYMTVFGNEEISRLYVNHLNNSIALNVKDALLEAARYPGVHVNRRSEGRVILEFKLDLIGEIEEGLTKITDSEVLKKYTNRYIAQFEIEGRRTIREGIKNVEYLVNRIDFFTVYIMLRRGL